MKSKNNVPRRPRDPRSKPDTKVKFQFVNEDVASNDGKARARAIVRANAAHFHWRHNRPPNDEPQTSSEGDHTDSRSSSSEGAEARAVEPTQLGTEIVEPNSLVSYPSELPQDFVRTCVAYSMPDISSLCSLKAS